jgi:hypothetical protein
MNYYKIIKDNCQTIQRFASLEEAQAYADSLGEGATAEFFAPYVPPTIQERLELDLQFGQQLVYVFVEDNRIMDITPTQSESVLQKFRDILAFAQTGAIPSIQTYLPLIAVDEVYTQKRKDKYVQMINDYLAQYA